MFLFADDANIYFVTADITKMSKTINEELKKKLKLGWIVINLQ